MAVVAGGGVPHEVCSGSGPVWLDDDRLIVGVERGDATVLAVVDVLNAWPRPIAVAGADYVTRRRVARPDERRLHPLPPTTTSTARRLHVVDLASGRAHAVVHQPGFQMRSPAWSPDGTRLAYASEWPGWYEVFIVDAAGDERASPVHRRAGRLRVARVVSRRSVAAGDRSPTVVSPTWCASTRRRARCTVLAEGGTWSSPHVLPDGGGGGSARVLRHAAAAVRRVARWRRFASCSRPHRPRFGQPARGARARRLRVARRHGGARLAVPPGTAATRRSAVPGGRAASRRPDRR